ncbi:metabolite traffic protein EboE [Rhodohalobacter sp. 8-1]|uniref:metabolite traffic protein EboE n=1 Tax=Rhodohalobacter sp. 8-1 TaxID=3131972 RepID=UPI0030EEA475
MKLPKYPYAHFSYCSNIHPGEEWADHFDQIKQHLPELKSRLSPDSSFGVGLRLSAKAASQLKRKSELDRFRTWLTTEDLYLFTMNGFPYGSFHGERVKDNVYAPDWTAPDRLLYTTDLIEILTELLPGGIDGGISTSPVSYKYWEKAASGTDDIFAIATINLARAARRMHKVYEQTGKQIHLDIEPEPDCLLENGTETLQFFKEWLFPKGSDFLQSEFSYSKSKAEEILKKHITVCYDTCHFALEYEHAKDAIDAFRKEGIRIGKTQVSSALKVDWTRPGLSVQNVLSRLKTFDEPVYLHQVIELRKDGSFQQYRDLPQALGAFDESAAKEWRIHFHVPLFLDEFEELHSTRDHIEQALPYLLQSSRCTHFEIETYTWEVLPERFKTNLTDSIEREYRWMLGLVAG